MLMIHTYLLVPESASSLADSEVQNVSDWAGLNNLLINKAKCKELIFIARLNLPASSHLAPMYRQFHRLKGSWCHTSAIYPWISTSGTLSHDHRQFLYALHVLRANGLSGHQLHLVCHAYLGNSLSYAMPAWRGFARLEHIQASENSLPHT